MSVKRYDMKEVFKGRMAVVETSAGAFVTHGDYAVLEQKLTDMAVQLANAESKCRELAAENATMKERASDVMKHVYRSKTYLDSNRIVDAIQGLQCAIERKPGETPATDAYLAEVRAQVAEDALKIMGGFTSDECGDSVYIAVKDFAAQLRKGAAL
ncbi:hypothetical protein HV170_13555 [Citrobacter freundii]|uniref:hypothetical protein n=1 Tax=Citrobacter freundii TaxID=546 RepID=UPI0015F58F60|nr:hypothetical protein [Citrobacter freundii]